MKKWVLLNKHNSKIVEMSNTKRGVMRKIPNLNYSRKDIKKLKQGDIVKAKYINNYKKWTKSNSSAMKGLYKDHITEISYKEFILDRV